MPMALVTDRRDSLPTSFAASKVVSTDRNVANRKNAMATLAMVSTVRRLFRRRLAQTRRANFIG